MVIKNIIFDYGAVIFDIDHQLTINAFKKLGFKEVDKLFGHLSQHHLFDEFEKGNISPDEFRTKLKNVSGKYPNDEEFDKAWNAMLLGIPIENFELLKQAKLNYRTFLLSNNNQIHYEWIDRYLQEKWNITGMMNDFFEKDHYSHLLHMRKPDSNIFDYMLDTYQLNPKETLFVDDSPQHIETAKKLSLNTYWMQKGQRLAEFFKTLQ